MAKHLYELTEAYLDIEKLLDEEYAEQLNIAESLSGIKDEIENKVENIAKLVLSLKADAEVVKTEEERLNKRRKAIENKVEWLKDYLLTEMLAVNVLKVKREVLSVTVQNNPPSVEIHTLDLIPSDYRKVIPETWQPDKKAIIEHFNTTGEIVDGTEVITSKKHIVIR